MGFLLDVHEPSEKIAEKERKEKTEYVKSKLITSILLRRIFL